MSESLNQFSEAERAITFAARLGDKAAAFLNAWQERDLARLRDEFGYSLPEKADTLRTSVQSELVVVVDDLLHLSGTGCANSASSYYADFLKASLRARLLLELLQSGGAHFDGFVEVGRIVGGHPVHGWHMEADVPWDQMGDGAKLYIERRPR